MYREAFRNAVVVWGFLRLSKYQWDWYLYSVWWQSDVKKHISIELEKGASVYVDQRVADQENKYANIVVLCLCTGQHSVIKKKQTFWSQACIVPGIYAGSIGLVEPQ